MESVEGDLWRPTECWGQEFMYSSRPLIQSQEGKRQRLSLNWQY